jgi:hypothetical protein
VLILHVIFDVDIVRPVPMLCMSGAGRRRAAPPCECFVNSIDVVRVGIVIVIGSGSGIVIVNMLMLCYCYIFLLL